MQSIALSLWIGILDGAMVALASREPKALRTCRTEQIGTQADRSVCSSLSVIKNLISRCAYSICVCSLFSQATSQVVVLAGGGRPVRLRSVTPLSILSRGLATGS